MFASPSTIAKIRIIAIKALGCLGLLAVVVFTYFTLLEAFTLYQVPKWETAKATVVAIENTGEGSRRLYFKYQNVTCDFTANGKPYQVICRKDAITCHPGQSVELSYNPNSPTQASLSLKEAWQHITFKLVLESLLILCGVAIGVQVTSDERFARIIEAKYAKHQPSSNLQS